MSFEQLQQLWATQVAGEVPLPDSAALVAKLQADSAEFDRLIARRDRRELLAGLFLLACYVLPTRHPQGPGWAYWAALSVLLLVNVFLVGFQWHAKRQRRKFGSSLTGELEWSLYHTRYQIGLLTHVVWWYLLPLGLATVLHLFYRHGTFTRADWIVTGFLLPVSGVVYWLNQHAVRVKLRPQLGQLTLVREQWQSLGRNDTLPPQP